MQQTIDNACTVAPGNRWYTVIILNYTTCSCSDISRNLNHSGKKQSLLSDKMWEIYQVRAALLALKTSRVYYEIVEGKQMTTDLKSGVLYSGISCSGVQTG